MTVEPRFLISTKKCTQIVTDSQQYIKKTHYTPARFGPYWSIIRVIISCCTKQLLKSVGLTVYVEELLVFSG
jgi:hypothetical protein